MTEISLLKMIAHQQQQRRPIYLHVKAKSFDFKLKMRNISDFLRISLIFKLWGSPVVIKAKSQRMQISILKEQKSLKSRFFKAIAKFRNRPTKKTPACQHSKSLSFKGSVGFISVVVASLAQLAQGIFANDEKRIIILCSIILLYVISLSKKFLARKTCILMILLNIAMVGCSLLVQVETNLRYASLWRYAWKAWTWTTSSQPLYVPWEFVDIFGGPRRFT